VQLRAASVMTGSERVVRLVLEHMAGGGRRNIMEKITIES
jgi:hypothetical protein